MARVGLEERETGTLNKLISRCSFCRGFHPDTEIIAEYLGGYGLAVDLYIYHRECANQLLVNPPPDTESILEPLGHINHILRLIKDFRNPYREISFQEYANRAADEVLAGRRPDNIPGSSKWGHLLDRINQLLKK